MSQIPARYYLIVRKGPTIGQAHALQGNMITIGRQLDNYLVVNDSQVSRYHVRLTWQDSTYSLDDLNSKNGTWVNDKRVSSPTLLRVGDLIDLGGHTRFTFSDHPRMPAPTLVSSPPEPVGVAAPAPVAAPEPSAPPRHPSGNRTKLGLTIGILAFLLTLLCVACLIFGLVQLGYLA